jgi:voltage-gated potassium channel
VKSILSRAGQVFTVVLLLGGVGTVLYALTLGVAAVVQGGFASQWEALRRARMIDELNDHFIVCGYGRMGRIIVREVRSQKR